MGHHLVMLNQDPVSRVTPPTTMTAKECGREHEPVPDCRRREHWKIGRRKQRRAIRRKESRNLGRRSTRSFDERIWPRRYA